MPKKWILVPIEPPERFFDGLLRTDPPPEWEGTIRHLEGIVWERYARWIEEEECQEA